MDNHTSCLTQQVSRSVAQLRELFDEMGVPDGEREAREAELFAALSEALDSQVRLVTAEKKALVDEASGIVTAMRQMEASLDGTRPRSRDKDDALALTYPLTRWLQTLRERHAHVSRLHRERFEQVKRLVDALESYSSHLEPTFVQIPLPPTGSHQSVPKTFDLSPAYVDRLDAEFTRVYEEYSRRIAAVQALADDIIQLWAELGTPQAQQDGAMVEHYRDRPEQLGLHEHDLGRLRATRDRLADDKKSREKRLRDLRAAVEALWAKLGVDAAETSGFLARTRGCGLRQVKELEAELARLRDLKRQHLDVFVEDARVQLQRLWDALYLSEDEMLEFTPAFSDVYSDALLEAHEREVARLEALREQRAPLLALVDRHKALVRDRDELAAASQDASRLMMRGQRGEKRDPGKLLREEKMRKRIAKELPRATADVRRALAAWEDESGRPFLVLGRRYLDELEDERPATAGAGAARSKTPAGLSRANSARAAPRSTTARGAAPPPPPQSAARGSPTKIPARVPLSSLKHGNNNGSPERRRPASAAATLRNGAPPRAPPPKMRELERGGQGMRQAEPQDVYGTGRLAEPEDVYGASGCYGRLPSHSSHASTAVSGSENWETYDDNSDLEPEPDASATYRAKLQAARGKRLGPGAWSEPAPAPVPELAGPGQAKRLRGLGGGAGAAYREGNNRIVSGSEWTDEEAF